MFDLAVVLPQLLPSAIAWAEARSEEVLQSGRPLNAMDLAVAKSVGVAAPERVRVLVATQLPLPEDPALREAALQTGLLGPGMIGLTLGYGIYLVAGYESPRLLSHECRHVHQYEAAGGIAAFLPVYLRQIVDFTYDHAPYEVDARTWERGGT
jgi:hypothetical protein